jgi:DNA-binding MarR family transcriptional regulator
MAGERHRPGDLGRLVRDAQRAIEAELLAGLARAGYPDLRPGHMLVFRHLDPSGMRVSDLARDARVTRQAVSQVVAELEGMGLLEQAADPTDRRAKVVRYTAHGRRGYATAEGIFAGLERRHGEAMGERALATTRRVLRGIARTDREG